MGQTTSSRSSLSSSSAATTGHGELGWLAFVGLWLGAWRESSLQQPLANSWEELLCWTDALTSWNLLSLQPTIHEKGQSPSFDHVAQRQQQQQVDGLEFQPTVDSNFADQVARLPCFSSIDRAIFYHQHVRIKATATNVMSRNDATLTTENHHHHQPSPIVLSVAELGRLYVLGRHVMELEATQHSTATTSRSSNEQDDIAWCHICYTEKENAQLPCGHGLCETCEARWVARKLTCPFCRTRYGSGAAARQGWNITEFNPQQLQSDIQTTLDRMHRLWNEILDRQKDEQTAKEATESTFVPLPPQLLETTQGPQDFELIKQL